MLDGDLLLASASVVALRTRSARADDPVDGEEAHPIDPPEALDFKMMSWATTPFYGGPSTAIGRKTSLPSPVISMARVMQPCAAFDV